MRPSPSLLFRLFARWSTALQKCNVVSRDESVVVSILDHFVDAVRFLTGYSTRFGAGIVHDAAGELSISFVDDAHDVAALEVSLHLEHSRSKQARFALDQRASCSFVDDDRRFHRGGKSNPSLLSGQRRIREKQSSQWLAGEDSIDDARQSS